jgi:hypothetical protein
VEGGYVVYHPEDHSLEIVATLSESFRAEAAASERLTGTYRGQLEAQGEGRYYDDGYGGRTRERALGEAQQASEAALDQAARERIKQAGDEAEAGRAAALQETAEERARERWEEEAVRRRAELSRRAAVQLNEVGVRARGAFHRLLAQAYQQALTALARRRGVRQADIHLSETDSTLEIEFTLPD